MSMSIEGIIQHKKLALITGAAGVIGKAIALKLASTGWELALWTKSDSSRIRALTGELSGKGSPAVTYFGDMTIESEVIRVIDKIEETQGVPLVAVHCVGPILYDRNPNQAVWMEMLSSTLLTAVSLLKHLLPRMQKNKYGRVILFGFSGVESQKGFQTIVSYAASKEALQVLVRSSAKQYARDGITINTISPGIVQRTEDHNNSADDRFLDKIPLGRLLAASEVAEIVSWLISDEADYITGQNIKVSGGFQITTPFV
jgi:3-oxoacyl-[acyl-carrier protein] reductase